MPSPPGFQRIRHYGFLANSLRREKLALCRQLLCADPTGLLPVIPPARLCTGSRHRRGCLPLPRLPSWRDGRDRVATSCPASFRFIMNSHSAATSLPQPRLSPRCAQTSNQALSSPLPSPATGYRAPRTGEQLGRGGRGAGAGEGWTEKRRASTKQTFISHSPIEIFIWLVFNILADFAAQPNSPPFYLRSRKS